MNWCEAHAVFSLFRRRRRFYFKGGKLLMEFEKEHEAFLDAHSSQRSGERLRRLLEGHGYLEKLFLQNVWWPAIGHFRYLHPEYEVKDFVDGTRFLDFAYLRPPYRIQFEADGYGPHTKQPDRWQYADQLMRQNHLILDGWLVFRFSSDDLLHKQRRCQQFLLHLIGRLYGDVQDNVKLNPVEKEIVRFFARSLSPVMPKDVAGLLGINPENARLRLQGLLRKGIIKSAVGGSERIRSYVLDSAGLKLHI
jgi:hypothetical protein